MVTVGHARFTVLTPQLIRVEWAALKVEIGPVAGNFPGMLRERGFELRLPGDWPPASVTVSGVPVNHAEIGGKGGWTFEGNTLTTVIPVASRSTSSRVTIEVKRAEGRTARRWELDGFAGMMTRLRGAYDGMNVTWPVSAPPDILVEAVQTGDRLSCHPKRASEEIAHLHAILPQAQAAVSTIADGFPARISAYVERAKAGPSPVIPIDYDAEVKRRLDALAKARAQFVDAGK